MRYKLDGTIAQAATLLFERTGEDVWAANGSLVSYADGLTWQLRVPGGLSGAVKRSFAGEGLSLTYLKAQSPQQMATLSANQPGHIMAWRLKDSGPVVATRGAFLAAWGDIDINVTVARRAGAAIFGGAGLFLQKVSGVGVVLIHGSGDFIEHNLRKGETLSVSTGNLAAFSSTIDYDIRGVGGCSKMLFSGEGLFMTHLTGPGRVLLQTLKRIPVQPRTT